MSISPENLQVIEEEESLLRETVVALREQLEHQSGKHHRGEKVLRGLTQEIVAARRAEDKQALASDEAVANQLRDQARETVESLEQILKCPYFARMVLEERENGQTRKIEYMIGHLGNVECRIVDWKRSPIARLFYEYSEGEEYSEDIQGRERNGLVLTRRKLNIVDGELRGVSTTEGDFIKDGTVWKESRKGLYGGKVRQPRGALPDVFSLVTREQFSAITSDADTAVLIQGVAGSGKTTVALNRIVWQVTNGEAIGNKAIALVRNPPLARYIKTSLEQLRQSLDEQSAGRVKAISVTLAEDWFVAQLAKVLPSEFLDEAGSLRIVASSAPIGQERLRRSEAMVMAIKHYLDEQRTRLVDFLEKNLPDEVAKSWAVPFNNLSRGKMGALAAVGSLQSLLERDTTPAFTEFKTQLSKVRKRLELYLQDYTQILEREGRLIAFDKTQLLDRGLIAAVRDEVKQSFEAKELRAEDIANLLLLYLGKWGQSSSHISYYDFMMVDEAQEFSLAELACISYCVPSMSRLTVVGDTEQAVSTDQMLPGWENLMEVTGERSSWHTLSVSHRSTQAIATFAEYIRGSRRRATGRAGRAPIWFHCRNEAQGLHEAKAWLERLFERYPGNLATVICHDSRTARYVASLLEPNFQNLVRLGDAWSFSFDDGILVTDIGQVHGLEFPHVLIWNPSSNNYPKSDRGRRALYTAVSRAEENICLVSWGHLSAHLPKFSSGLVRVKVRYEESQEQGE